MQINTFQCILATDGFRSFVIYFYADGMIQWTTGDASGGEGGFGGTPAQVGFNAGDGVRYAIVPGSRTADIVNIDMTSNIGVPGVWVFRVDGGNVTMGGCSFEPDGKLVSIASIQQTHRYCTTTTANGDCSSSNPLQ